MKVRHASISDTGLRRKRNEDRFLVDEPRGLYGIADGIGGLPHGAEAAQMILDRLAVALPKAPLHPTMWELQQAVQAANTDVLEAGRRLNPPMGIGSTLTLGSLNGHQLQLVHAGDSRCYVWRRGRLTQATIDHTVEHDPKFSRQYRMNSSLYAGQRGALTRCIGQVEPVELECHLIYLDPEDRLLFATDGLFKGADEESLNLAISSSEDPQSCLQRLVQEANERGGLDNATGVMLILEE